MTYTCTYRILVVDADDKADALRQAKDCAAAANADWDITEATDEPAMATPK